jgi:hypothetical protein
MSYVFDLSVLVAAASKTDQLPGEQIGNIYLWLYEFINDDGKHFALDDAMLLWVQYKDNVEADNFLLRALQNKIDKNCYYFENVSQTVDGKAILGPHWAHLDDHRRWVGGVAVCRPNIAVVNATHHGWHKSATKNDAACKDIVVKHLIESWLDEDVLAKARTNNSDTDAKYYFPPKNLSGSLIAAKSMGVGTNKRQAWEDTQYRYEFDSQHGTVEVYSLSSGKWQREAQVDGTTTKTTGGEGRRWGKK